MNKDKESPLFKAIQEIDFKTLDNFNNWIVNEAYQINYLTGRWQKNRGDIKMTLSELYKIFLNETK